MPTGHAGLMTHVVQWARRIKPKSVLDLGIGYGLTGAILRNYFGANRQTGVIYPLKDGSGFHVRGVEIFAAYRNPMWDCYDEVAVGNIKDSLHLCEQVDAVICNDVFEHLPKDVGVSILQRSPKAFVGICQVMGQGTVYGNSHEAHTTRWTQAELGRFCTKTFELNKGYIVGTKE